MNKQYIINQIIRVQEMIIKYEESINQKTFEKFGNNIKAIKEAGIKRNKELTNKMYLIIYNHNKHKEFKLANKSTLLSLLDDLIKLGYKNNVNGFDQNFVY